MRRTVALSLASLLTLVACAPLAGAPAQSAAPTSSIDQPFTLSPGGAIVVGPDGVRVIFDRVMSDSRCPRDAQCIQAGEAVVRVLVTVSGKPREQVEVRTSGKQGATIGQYTLILSSLAPVPLATRQTRASDYRATFVLSRT